MQLAGESGAATCFDAPAKLSCLMDSTSEPTPFADAAAFYDAGRPPYAPEALSHVVAGLNLKPTSRLLDLGCGPGSIAIPLSRHVAEVVAVDIDANMLAEGRKLAAAQGHDNIRWIQGRAEDVLPTLEEFHAATLGQSLHWMDRDLVLAMLGDIIAPGGGLAILDEGLDHAPESWMATARQILARYVGRRPRHPGKHPEEDHAPSLSRSAHFADFTVREFPIAFTRDPASVLTYLYSSVGAGRPLFGDRLEAFEAELTEALLRLNPAGVFEERLASTVFLAPRR